MSKNLIDNHKLQYHPIRVAQVLQADTWEKAKHVYPIYAEYSPINNCNHDCSFCGIDYARVGGKKLDLEIFKTRIKEMASLGLKSLMFAGEGEPLLHKDISAMVAATREAGVDVAFTTNAVPMTEKFIKESMRHIDWIKVSFNAGSPENYAKIHRTKERDFHKVVENIKFAVQYKIVNDIQCSVGMQMVLLDDNAHEIEMFVQLAKSLGVDYAVIKRYSQHNYSDTRIYKHTDYSKYLEIEKTLEKYNTDDFSVVFRSNSMVEHEPYTKCMSTPNLWMYIDSNNHIYACSAYLLQERFNLGDLTRNTFQEIWHGDKRKALFEEGIDIKGCRANCRMDSCNRYLLEVSENPPDHVNFI